MNSPDTLPSLKNKALPWLWFFIAFAVILLDQWTKALASSAMVYEQKVVVTSFFNFTLRYNHGVAFSLFNNIGGAQRWPLSLLAFAVSVALIVWIFRIGKRPSIEVVGLTLVLGGAIGNLYDRVLLGYVVDFIELHYHEYYWPAFNIADSAICAGAMLLLYDAFFTKK